MATACCTVQGRERGTPLLRGCPLSYAGPKSWSPLKNLRLAEIPGRDLASPVAPSLLARPYVRSCTLNAPSESASLPSPGRRDRGCGGRANAGSGGVPLRASGEWKRWRPACVFVLASGMNTRGSVANEWERGLLGGRVRGAPLTLGKTGFASLSEPSRRGRP